MFACCFAPARCPSPVNDTLIPVAKVPAPTQLPDLPADIQERILLRLSARDVARLNRVARAWRTMLVTADESFWRALLARHKPDLAPVVFACIARHFRQFRMREVYRATMKVQPLVVIWGTGELEELITDPPRLRSPGPPRTIFFTNAGTVARQVTCSAHAVFVVHSDRSVWMLGRLREDTMTYRGLVGKAWTQGAVRISVSATTVLFQRNNGRWYLPRSDGDMDAELVPADIPVHCGLVGGGGSSIVFRDSDTGACVKYTGDGTGTTSAPCTHRDVNWVGHTDSLGAIIATGSCIYREPPTRPEDAGADADILPEGQWP
ncbi:hypothetical protein H9P43_002782 [Blastocladiella emersonii ATCC 22665]|nr:hypothetical protein H9P43_002782 [Blastocladiella emersonii ATCC 22665]